MAFSSLREVLHVGFMNEKPEDEQCSALANTLKLKEYDSQSDFRSWSLDKEVQSHFVSDLVACRTHSNDIAGGDCGGKISEAPFINSKNKGLVNNYESDSLLELAKLKLTNIDELIAKNKNLQNQLEISQENLNILKDENKKIKKIVACGTKLQPLNPFQAKIKKLKESGQLSIDDEKELLELQKQFGKKDKAYEVLEAENASLRKLAEKLSRRANFDKIKTAPETCTDVRFLQDKINRLQREVLVLRNAEEEFLNNKVKECPDKKSKSESSKLDKIIKERNSFKEQLEKLNGLEAKILDLMKKADEACRLQKENAALKQKIAKCCTGPPIDPKDYEALKCENARLKDLVHKLKDSESCLRVSMAKLQDQNKQLQERMQDAELELKKLDTLHQELCLARSQLQRKDCMLRQYECQLFQMKDVIKELSDGRQPCEVKNISDDCTQTKDDHLDDLEWAARETLNQIKCEIEARGCLQKEMEETKVKKESEISGLKEANQDLKDNLDQTEADCCAKVAKLMSDLEAAKKKETDLLKQLSDGKNAFENEKRKSANLLDTQGGLMGDVGRLGNDIAAKENEIKGLKSKISDLEEQLRKCLAAQKSDGGVIDDGELDRLRNQLKDLQSKLDEEIKKNQACEAQLDAAEKARQAADSRAAQQPTAPPNEPSPVQQPPKESTRPEDTTSPDVPAPTSTEAPSSEAPSSEAASSKTPAQSAPVAPSSAGSKKQGSSAPPPHPKAGDRQGEPARPPATTATSGGKSTPKAGAKKVCKKPCKKPTDACKKPTEPCTKEEPCKNEQEDDAEKYKCKHLERNRSNYGYVCDQKMADSLLNISQQISELCHSDNIERDVTKILKNLKDDLVSCQKYMKGFPNKLETICQKIIDKGIDCLDIADLIYLHREVYNAGMKLNPEAISSIMDEEVKCCKCKKFACCLPEYPKKNEKKLFMQITNLQTQIDSIGPDISRLAAQNKMKFLSNLTPHSVASSTPPPSSTRCGVSLNSIMDSCSYSMNQFCGKNSIRG